MRVLLVSTYELGHQPLHVASPAAALRRDGFEVDCLDLAVEPLDPGRIDRADAVAVSVPMHTAMRLGVALGREIKARHPDMPLCFYGLYAPLARDPAVGVTADHVIAGEYETPLRAWAAGLAGGRPARGEVRSLGHDDFTLPARELLPPLQRYAHLSIDGTERPVGYVEASHGCAHECRHCPVPVVYGGRIRLVPAEVVLADIDGLVAAGARHITFGDPDFLNGWRHSLRIVETMAERHPGLTFDCTTKVEHVLRHERLWERLAAAGCLFVVSAFECVDDAVLTRLDKGYTTAQAAAAVRLLRAHGIEVRPSWLPFHPWTTPGSVLDICDFVATHDLVGNVDPVQYSIRLLVPEGSLLLGVPELRSRLRGYDPQGLTYRWEAEDPAADALHAEIRELVENPAGRPPGAVFLEVYAAAARAAGRGRVPAASGAVERPRLTEPWFC